MKKITLHFVMFLAYTTANPQQEISRAYATEASAMFGPINKTLVPNGILLY